MPIKVDHASDHGGVDVPTMADFNALVARVEPPGSYPKRPPRLHLNGERSREQASAPTPLSLCEDNPTFAERIRARKELLPSLGTGVLSVLPRAS